MMKKSTNPRALACALRGLAALALGASLSAQLEYGGDPPSRRHILATEAPTVTMRPVDVGALVREDATRGKGVPFRFGEEIPVDLGLSDAGAWEELPGGARVWRLRIESSGAHSLSLLFSRFQLPESAELFIYDDGRETVRGAYTYLNHNVDGGFAIQPIAGDAVTLELYEPPARESGGVPSELRLSGVVHDYRNVLEIFAAQEEALTPHYGSCETDVNCPVGNPHRDQIDATTMVIIGGGLCSGSLLNNTAQDGTQYYMSANHCGGMNSAVFRFNYQRANCGSGSAPTNQTVQGSVQMATSSSFDYRLVRITPQIPASYGAFYAGWDRTDVPPASTFTVHHPQGLPKKISFDNDSPVKSGSQWRILQWDLGVTQPGSSGSPLYTPQGRFIGQLCCGAAACGFPFDDFYGRMASQWSQIASFLDPLGTGQTTLDGHDPNGIPVAAFSAMPTSGNSPLNVSFSDLSTGNITSWDWDFGDGGSSTAPNPAHVYQTTGNYPVSLTVSGPQGMDTLEKTAYIQVNPTPPADFAYRNGTGINPSGFTQLTMPVIGTVWETHVARLGAPTTIVGVGYRGPFSFINSSGELLIRPPTLKPLDLSAGSHEIPIPNDAGLLGRTFNTQAATFDSGQIILQNAIDICIGF